MKIVIIFDERTGEIFYYVPDTDTGDTMFIEPRVKKKEWEVEKDEERTH